MKVLVVALHDLRVRLQDRSALFLAFLAPMLVIALAAVSFAHLNTPADAPREVVVVNLDSHIGPQQIDKAIAQMGTRLKVHLFDAPDKVEPALEGLSRLTLAADLSARLTEVGEGRQQLDIAVKLAVDKDKAVIADFVRQLSRVVTGQLPKGSERRLVDAEVPDDDSGPSALSLGYFAPSMMIFFLMYASFGGTRTLLQDKESGLLARLLYLPIAPFSLLLGKILAVFAVALLQLLVLILCSALLPGMDWGESFAGLVLMCLALAAAFTSFGIFIAIFAKDANQANVLGTGIILLFSLLGGTFVPVTQFPDWLRQLGLISINRWGLDGIFDLTIRHQPLSGVLLESGVLAGFAVVFFSLSLWRFQQQVTR